jgi:hypothetical protein
MRSSHHEPAFGIEVRERACTDEFGVHDHASTPKVPLSKITRFGQVTNRAIRSPLGRKRKKEAPVTRRGSHPWLCERVAPGWLWKALVEATNISLRVRAPPNGR